MREVTLEELSTMASDAREAIWSLAQDYGREPKIYLHWTAGHYHQKFDDYHVNIDQDGRIFVSTDDLSDVLAHTWRRNSGSVGITLDCCAGATSEDLGDAADNVDGLNAHEDYGPQSTVERWDLQFLGTDESPVYTADYDDPATGGNVLRGKALWYKNQKDNA